MSDEDAKTTAVAREQRPELPDEERALLLRLGSHMSYRATLYADLNDGLVGNARDTQYDRLDINQETLVAVLEEVIANPGLARALTQAGYSPAELRQAGADGAWNSDIAEAVRTVQAGQHRHDVEREQSQRNRRGIEAVERDRSITAAEGWLDDLERQARDSLSERATSRQVAETLAEWAGEAILTAAEPTASLARAAFARRHHLLEEGATETVADAPRHDRQQVEDDRHRVTPESASGPAADPGDKNEIQLPDGSETVESRRQVENLSRVLTGSEMADGDVARMSLLQRLGGLIGGRGAEAGKTSLPAARDDDGDLPESLRRRYAVHVSDSGKVLQLFERDAKVPAITLDARSISTPHDAGAVLADMVALARDRGWQALKVSGTADFRDAIWLEGQKAGLTVHHEPSPAVRAAFAKWDEDRPLNQIQRGHRIPEGGPDGKPRTDLGAVFASKSAEERLADPRLRNAQLELMVGVRTAEKELGRPIGDMPDVMRALTVAVGQQLTAGKVFDAPFVKPESSQRAAKQVTNPQIEADRIPPPRP